MTADRHLVFKNGIKEIAAQEGRAATFMAKWTMDDVGSSCHVHTSLWDAESGDALDGGRRRTRAGCRPSGAASWPDSCTRHASWPGWPPRRSTPTGATCPGAGRPPRWCGARTTARAASALVGHGAGRRVESRVPGADVNPYLVAGGRHRGRPLRHRPRARARRPLPAQRLRGDRRARASPRPWSRRSPGCATRPWRSRPSGPRCTTTSSTRPSRSGRPATAT